MNRLDNDAVLRAAEQVIADEVMAFGAWRNNAELMLACRQLGYLDDEHPVWDATYGTGRFWRLWKPAGLIGTDLNPKKSQIGRPVDFTDSGFADREMHHITFDPPYKLSGTPSLGDFDDRYGVDERRTMRERLSTIDAGVVECARVLGDGFLLVKVQDMVCGGKVRWQTDEVTATATQAGLRKVDRFDFVSYRPQPDDGRTQRHARRNTSTLLVFTRPGPKRRKKKISPA